MDKILAKVIRSTLFTLKESIEWKVALDLYPVICIALVLPAIAALQVPVIMLGQNRKEEKDRRQNENDYLINLKAEVEVRSLHQKMDLLLEGKFKILFDSRVRPLERLKPIEEKLGGRKGDCVKLAVINILH